MNTIRRLMCVFLCIAVISSLFSLKAVSGTNFDVSMLTLEENNEGYTITKCNSNALGDIVLPDSYNGLPITTIGRVAFGHNNNITSIVIPDSVTDICEEAFQGCRGLKSVALPNNLTSIGDAAFTGCSSLESIVFPDSLTSIGYYAFSSCRLKTITIPKNVGYIGDGAFRNNQLESIYVDEDNTTFYSDSFGGLYNLRLNTLIMFPSAADCNSYSILEGTTIIQEDAFRGSIIKHIYFPESISSICESAFDSYSYIQSVCYPGTAEKWNEILIAYGNDKIKTADLHLHEHGEDLKTEIINKKQADCLNHGYTGDLCYTECGFVIESGEDIKPFGKHSYKTECIKPTCVESGYTIYKCQNCSHEYTADIVPAKGHDFTNWYMTVSPTTTETGSIQRDCKVCKYSETGVLEKLQEEPTPSFFQRIINFILSLFKIFR